MLDEGLEVLSCSARKRSNNEKSSPKKKAFYRGGGITVELKVSISFYHQYRQEEIGYVRRGSVSRQACFHMLGAFSAPADLIKTCVIPLMLPYITNACFVINIPHTNVLHL